MTTPAAGPMAGAAAKQPSRGDSPAVAGVNLDDLTKGAKQVRLAHKGDKWETADGKTYTGEWQDVPASKVVALIKAAKLARVHLRVRDTE